MWKALGQMPKVHVLHMWHIHTQVQQRVMGQLLKLATASDDIKEMVANHGGLVQVLQGMQSHPRNNGLQRAGHGRRLPPSLPPAGNGGVSVVGGPWV